MLGCVFWVVRLSGDFVVYVEVIVCVGVVCVWVGFVVLFCLWRLSCGFVDAMLFCFVSSGFG